jgi:hypothetical protein
VNGPRAETRRMTSVQARDAGWLFVGGKSWKVRAIAPDGTLWRKLKSYENATLLIEARGFPPFPFRRLTDAEVTKLGADELAAIERASGPTGVAARSRIVQLSNLDLFDSH